jgi:uncharacterized protein (TIGR02145 family)
MKCKICRLCAAAAIILMTSIAVADKYLIISTTPLAAITCNGPDEVKSAGGRCWKDRNLGASQVATNPIDGLAFGDYYQWGRLRDGHQYPHSPTTLVKSARDEPRHWYFIRETSVQTLRDWRIPQNDNLWQGLQGINNPCPQGFRIPTAAEWETERASWDSQDAMGAYASPLKLVLAGLRYFTDGTIISKTTAGHYWSSTVSSFQSRELVISSNQAKIFSFYRAAGSSIRCIKD